MRFWYLTWISLVSVCCVSNEHSFSDKVSVDPITVSEEGKLAEAKFVVETGVDSFDKTQKIEWFTCALASKKPFIVLLNPSDEPLTKASACQNSVAAEALSQGFNVLLLNRPGQAQSSGAELFGDAAAIQSSRKLIETKKAQGHDIQGLWAYGDGTVQAFRLAKQFPFRFLVIGDGIYDWEKTVKEAKDPNFKLKLEDLQRSGSDTFVEDRSVAWDFAGLPKQVLLYHNNKNLRVLPEQAQAFKASLAASEYKVELFLVESEGAGLPGPFHRGLAQKILAKLKSLPLEAP